MKTLFLSIAVLFLASFSSLLAHTNLKKIKSLAEIDYSSHKVQFKNIATGQYVALSYDDNGNVYLKATYEEEEIFWNFHATSNTVKSKNLEILRFGDEESKWLNKQKSTRNISPIVLGRQPSTSNSLWNLYNESPGVFRITDSFTEESIAIRPDLSDKLVSQPTKADNDYQLWEIYADKKKNNIMIAHATWSSGEEEIIVTNKIRELVGKGTIRFEAKNKILDSNLYTGKKNKLTIVYKKDGAVYTKSCYEQEIFEF